MFSIKCKKTTYSTKCVDKKFKFGYCITHNILYLLDDYQWATK